MVVDDQPRLPHQNGAAAATVGTSGVGGGGGTSRPPKKQKKEKLPQRGLGVAELERILRDQQSGAATATPAPAPVVAADTSWLCQGSSSSRRERPFAMASASPSTSGAINLQMEPPSNQINKGSSSSSSSSSYTFPPWSEEERIYGMRRPWTFPFTHSPTGPSILSRVPLLSRIELPPSTQGHDPFRSESICGNMNRNIASGCGEPDNKIAKEDTGQVKDGRFLTLGPSAPPILPTTQANLKSKQPVVTISPPMCRELPELGMLQHLYGSVDENSPWRPLHTPFYEFLPVAPGRQQEMNSEEQPDQEGDEVDLNLKL